MSSKKAVPVIPSVHRGNLFDPDHVAGLIVKYWFNELDSGEKATLERWIDHSPANKEEFESLRSPEGMLDALAQRFPALRKKEPAKEASKAAVNAKGSCDKSLPTYTADKPYPAAVALRS